jgi:hypothetical protein
MELERLIADLSDPLAYPDPAATVEVRQTHASVVFLTGGWAYKMKKPVRLGFLDFGTLESRRHFCHEEVRLNRRLAAGVYRDVVPVALEGGRARMEGRGEPIEWAVKMERLPEEATLRERLRRGEVDVGMLEGLARAIAAFHARAEGAERAAPYGRFEVVARNARENFEQSAPRVGTTVSSAVFERLRVLVESELERLHPLLEGRAARGVPRDTHGDLRLDHVYFLPERGPDAPPVVVDCIEFNERFRFADPVADAAFLVMDLASEGRRDLARAFADAYFRASGDEEGRALLPFYVSYRAAVRGKVEGFELGEKEVPGAERIEAVARARAHWLLALGELEEPRRRPCLVLVAGLPGTGKSTLAQGLAAQAGFEGIRSDAVRKELAGRSGSDPAHAAFGEGIYTTVWTERTYAECLRRAERLLFEGRRVLVDANFREEKRRRDFLEGAVRSGVPVAVLVCTARPEEVKARLDARRGDVSDADWQIYRKVAERWDPVGPEMGRVVREISTGGPPEETLGRALGALREFGLVDSFHAEVGEPPRDDPGTSEERQRRAAPAGPALGLRDDGDRAGRGPDDLARDAPEEEAPRPAEAARAQDDEVRAGPPRETHDLPGG